MQHFRKCTQQTGVKTGLLFVSFCQILVYSMNHHEYQWRIDVRTDGTLAISAVTGTQAYDWVSLSGIVFEPV